MKKYPNFPVMYNISNMKKSNSWTMHEARKNELDKEVKT